MPFDDLGVIKEFEVEDDLDDDAELVELRAVPVRNLSYMTYLSSNFAAS